MPAGFVRLTDEEAARSGMPIMSRLTSSSGSVSFGGIELPLRIAVHRGAVCMLAVSLLWCTSLAVSRRVANSFVRSPSLNAVVHECRRTYNEVHRQRDAHMECTKRQTTLCQESLQASLEAETGRARAVGRSNTVRLALAKERQHRCAMRQLQALESVQRLQTAGIPLVWNDDSRSESSSCSAVDRGRARALVGDISVARSHALDVAARYTQNVQALQRLSLDSLDRLQGYDAQYVSRKAGHLRALPTHMNDVTRREASRLKTTLTSLNASLQRCAPDSEADYAAPSRSSRCELPLQRQIQQMRSQYDALLTAMQQQQSELVGFHKSMTDMVSSVKPPLDTIKRLAKEIDPGMRLPDLEVPEVHLPEVHLPPLPSMDELKAQLRGYTQQQQAEARSYLQQAVGSTERWEKSVSEATVDLDGLLDDYRPPRFNTSAARMQMDSESERFVLEQQDALSAFAPTPTFADANRTTLLLNDTFDVSGVPSLIRQTGLRFEPLSQSSIDVELVTMAMANIASIATLCDLIWRGWRSMRLVLKYWSKAAVGLPTLDLREARADSMATSTCAELGKSPERCFSALFLSPLSGFTLIAAAFVLMLNVAAALYVPTYFSYVDGCINPPRNGTFLSRNLFSVSYNYAATEGNQRLLHELDVYHSARSANCSVEVRNTAREQLRVEREARLTQQAYQQALDDVRLMRNCLRLEELDAKAASAAIHPYVPLRAVLAADACEAGSLHEEALRIDNAVFNCSAVAECKRACDGPSREITATLCQRCGCHAEWLAHGMVLHVLLALLVFACINACRVLLIDGACRVLWKQLFAGQFEFIANCDDYGMASAGRTQILDALRTAVRGHAQTGWLMLLGALALNVPWMVALDFVGHHLDVGHSTAPGLLS